MIYTMNVQLHSDDERNEMVWNNYIDRTNIDKIDTDTANKQETDVKNDMQHFRFCFLARGSKELDHLQWLLGCFGKTPRMLKKVHMINSTTGFGLTCFWEIRHKGSSNCFLKFIRNLYLGKAAF